MGQPLVHVDAFAERPFEGNPAAVLILKEPRLRRPTTPSTTHVHLA